MGHKMATTFQRRYLRVTIQLSSGTFDKEGNPDKVTFDTPYRITAEVDQAGGQEYSRARIQIYGVPREVMNRCFVLNYNALGVNQNIVTLEATDKQGNYSTLFSGTIYQCYPSYNEMPEVPMIIESTEFYSARVTATSSENYMGTIAVSTIVSKIANTLSLSFENNGVSSYVTDQYLSGSAIDKLNAISRAANFQYIISSAEKVLAIMPINGNRKTVSKPIFNAGNGLVGIPQKVVTGVTFSTVFDPAIRLGQVITLETDDAQPTAGDWWVFSMSHVLASNLPGGSWFTHYFAAPIGFVTRGPGT